MSRVYYPFGHFPTAATHGAPNSNGFLPACPFPVALSLADALLWYWRVKRWRATLTIGGLSGSNPGYPNQGSFTASGLSVVQDFVPAYYAGDGAGALTAVTDETQLALPCSLMPSGSPAIGGSGTSTETRAGNTTPTTAALDFSASNIGLLVTLPGQYADDTFYPIVQFSADMMSSDPTGIMSFDLGVNNEGLYDGTAVTPASVMGTLLGKPFPLTVGIAGFSGQAIVTSATGLSLDITAAEYWPYADANGNALYDATTGAPL